MEKRTLEYDYLGRRTNNDLEGFNRQLNRFLHSPHPNIYKFVDHIKGIDQKNSLRIIEHRKNPIDYGKWSLPSKQVEKETKLQRLMTAYKNDHCTIQEIEDMNLLNNAQDTSAYLRQLEEDGEADI
jgi:hypothetical protein